MSKSRSRQQRRTLIVIYVFMLIILLTLLTVASYTWFSLSTTPRVSDMNMYITSKTGLELSQDPQAEEWVMQLDFRELVDVTTPLRPITWSDSRQSFIAATYGIDGRLTGYDSWQPLTDERNANKDNLDGYYIKATFYAKTGETVKVHLSPAVEIDDGINGSGTYVIGAPLWDSEELFHDNGGQGAESAIRIGIRTTPVDLTGEPLPQEATDRPSQFYIYEPNADSHEEGVAEGYVDTPSIDGTETLIDRDHIIRQTASSWTEADPVQRTVVVKTLGEFVNEPELFALEPGEMVRIDLYVWLEGQDADCTNRIEAAQILANIQFYGETESQSGMVPIGEEPEQP